MKKQILIIGCALMFSFASVAQIKVSSSGKVAIGNTANPTSYGVDHLFTGTKIAFAGSTSSITSSALIRGNNGYSSATTPDYTWYGNDQTGFFHPSTNVIGYTIGGSEKLRISSSGYLGIGDASPAALFTVGNGDKFQVDGNGILRTANGLYSGPAYSFTGYTNTGMYVETTYGTALAFAWNGTEMLRLNSTGVGIGTGSVVDSKFHVNNGYITISESGNKLRLMAYNGTEPEIGSSTDKINFWYSTYNYNKLYAESYNIGSDSTLKENISNLNLNSLNIVSLLKGKTYNLKKDSLKEKHIGFIAQDIQNLIPEAVSLSSYGDLCIDYSAVIVVMAEAIKEQQNQIETLSQITH